MKRLLLTALVVFPITAQVQEAEIKIEQPTQQQVTNPVYENETVKSALAAYDKPLMQEKQAVTMTSSDFNTLKNMVNQKIAQLTSLHNKIGDIKAQINMQRRNYRLSGPACEQVLKLYDQKRELYKQKRAIYKQTMTSVSDAFRKDQITKDEYFELKDLMVHHTWSKKTGEVPLQMQQQRGEEMKRPGMHKKGMARRGM